MNAVQCSEDDMGRMSSPMLTFRGHHLPQAREQACMCRLLDGDPQACQTT